MTDAPHGPDASWQPKQREWNWADLFGAVEHSELTLPPSEREQHRDMLWRDMCTEFDARYLEAYLAQKDITLSSEFNAFCNAWRHDENQHYSALRRIYSLLFGDSEDAINHQMKEREVAFEPISHLLRDEFDALFLLTFDEFTSAHAYLSDVPVYESFGPSGFAQWARYASRDEALHARNAVTIIKRRHPHRVAEVPAVLDRILDHIRSDVFQYKATFVLNDQYDDEEVVAASTSIRECFKGSFAS